VNAANFILDLMKEQKGDGTQSLEIASAVYYVTYSQKDKDKLLSLAWILYEQLAVIKGLNS
jgi:hypothetical protein